MEQQQNLINKTSTYTSKKLKIEPIENINMGRAKVKLEVNLSADGNMNADAVLQVLRHKIAGRMKIQMNEEDEHPNEVMFEVHKQELEFGKA